jgi:DNA mismatch repair protein MutL
MAKVKLLSKETAELIAAGEVIERPASVAKELIENAIDSGATKITIEIRGGGVSFLRVTDDGCGIAFEDVPVAFLRHATSKISTGSDLDAIFTLGFRGEALASVCAVSKTELFTKEKGVDFGTHYVINGGEEEPAERVGCPDGTSIIIRDLFFNVPARLKFLKKDISEGNAVAAIVHRICLSHPEIAFSFIRDNRRELQTSGDGDLFAAVHAVLGRQFAASLIPVGFEYRGVGVAGFISRPLFARANRSYEYFFVNGRSIRSFICMNAVEEAFKNSVMGGRFPACVLHISLPPAIMDVNAHPSKLEVKFSDEKLIYDSVFFAVKNALMNDSLPIEISPEPTKESPPDIYQHVPTKTVLNSVESVENIIDIVENRVNSVENANLIPFHSVNEDAFTHNIGSTTFRYLPESAFATPKSIQNTEPHTKPYNTSDGESYDPVVTENMNAEYQQDMKLIGEAFATYIICEYDNDLYIIDKHAAHERILFEELRRGDRKLSCQYIFGEKPLPVSETERATAEEFADDLSALGFDFSIEDGVINFTGIPSVLADVPDTDIDSVFAEILENLTLHKNDPLPELIDEILHSIACKAAIKGNRFTGAEELLSLAERVLKDNAIRYCPHGRPVIFKISQRELEKNFKRIQ